MASDRINVTHTPVQRTRHGNESTLHTVCENQVNTGKGNSKSLLQHHCGELETKWDCHMVLHNVPPKHYT